MTLSHVSAARDATLAADPGLLTRDDRAQLFRYMAMMRAAEERGLTLYKQGKVPGSFYDGSGQEAISVGAAFALAPEDRICILHRDLGAHFVRGVTPDRYLANYMGRSGGVTGGKDGNMHFGDRELGCVGMVSMLPDMAQVATGIALAFKMRGEPRVAMTFFGEGSTANGQWHEAMNFAGIHRLPVVFVLENNQFAYSTPNELEFAVDPVRRAEGYGFPGQEGRRQRRRGGLRGRPRGGRAGPRRARPDADRVRDDAHARPRRPRRHELRARRDARGVGAARPDRALRGAAACRHRLRRRGGRADPRSRCGAYVAECAETRPRLADARAGDREPTASSPTSGQPLGDGEAPWSRWQSARAAGNGNGRVAGSRAA